MTREGRLYVILLIALLALTPLLVAKSSMAIGVNAPKQPIDFFHRIHAGKKEIACGYCHAQTKTSSFAGMPSTALCMRCHRAIIPNHPEIQKLHKYWETESVVPWERVNHLPGFVFFTHKAHINANVPCSTCHGDLKSMDIVRQTAPLNMGWCLDCHRQKNAPTDCVTCHR